MRILFINLPYYGHIVPTIGLVQELIRKGCEVTYLLPSDWEKRISESGAHFIGYQNHRQLSEQIKNAYAAADAIARNFDLILYEQFFFLGKHLADKYGKPAVRIFTAPATNEKLMAEYLSARGPMSIFRHKWIARAFTKDIVKNIPMKTDNWLDEIIHNPPGLNLVYTLREYQPYEETFSEEQYRFLGPSIYERALRKFDFVKGEKPVVYISMGTIMKGSVAFFRNCIEAFRNEQVDVILSVGKGIDPGRLKNIPSNVRIYSSVPQTEVLEMADVFVTHGGMNSVSEALVSETPMVIIPLASDQPVNAASMEKLGVAKRLEYAQVNPDRIRQSVFSVMSDKAIKTALADVRRKIALAPGNRGAAEMILCYGKNTDEI